MGRSASKPACGGCFGGLFGGKVRETVPDCSPQGRRDRRVNSLDEALTLRRERQGSWEPSPRTQTGLDPSEWASPVPAGGRDAGSDVSVELELVIDEIPQEGSAVQLDTDVPFALSSGDTQQRRKRSKLEVEQLVASPGSLPKPMTAHQRESAIRSLLPTATHEMLARLPADLLEAQTQETQQLRRQLARGATVVFISAGLPGKRFTFERAAALGIKSVIIEHPDSWSRSLVEEGVVAKFIPVDMAQSSERVYQDALSQIRQLSEDGLTGPADAIATFVELSVPLVARLAEALGLPGHRPAAVDGARNKHATRAALKAAGLPTPRNALIRSASETASAGREVGFPAVLKPVSGAASLGVKKVTSMEELDASYGEIVAELSTLVVSSGALIKGDANSGGVDASSMVDLTVLMEQYLDGCEVDVDVVMSGGGWKYAAVADNGPTLEPYFNETWAVCPSLLPRDQQVALKELAVGSVRALGFEAGVFHVECKYTSTGPQLIEVNARMGGGQVRECNLRTWGVDLVEETLFAALGIPAGPMVPRLPLASVAYGYVNAPRSGTVRDLSGLRALLQRPGVVWAKPLVANGARATGPEDGLPTWLCDLLVTGATPKEALELLHALEAEHPVRVE